MGHTYGDQGSVRVHELGEEARHGWPVEEIQARARLAAAARVDEGHEHRRADGALAGDADVGRGAD